MDTVVCRLVYAVISPFVPCSVIRDMIRLEKSLDECLERLKSRCTTLHGDADLSDTDDLDSIASGSASINTFGVRKSFVRFAGHHREVERLAEKISKLERENTTLRHQVKELKILLGIPAGSDEKDEEEKKAKEEETGPTILSEGGVWNLLRKIDRNSVPDT